MSPAVIGLKMEGEAAQGKALNVMQKGKTHYEN